MKIIRNNKVTRTTIHTGDVIFCNVTKNSFLIAFSDDMTGYSVVNLTENRVSPYVFNTIEELIERTFIGNFEVYDSDKAELHLNE